MQPYLLYNVCAHHALAQDISAHKAVPVYLVLPLRYSLNQASGYSKEAAIRAKGSSPDIPSIRLGMNQIRPCDLTSSSLPAKSNRGHVHRSYQLSRGDSYCAVVVYSISNILGFGTPTFTHTLRRRTKIRRHSSAVRSGHSSPPSGI